MSESIYWVPWVILTYKQLLWRDLGHWKHWQNNRSPWGVSVFKSTYQNLNELMGQELKFTITFYSIYKETLEKQKGVMKDRLYYQSGYFLPPVGKMSSLTMFNFLKYFVSLTCNIYMSFTKIMLAGFHYIYSIELFLSNMFHFHHHLYESKSFNLHCLV